MNKLSRPVLGIIGGGNMGSALVRGLLAGDFSAEQILIVEKDNSRIAELRREFANVEVASKLARCDSVVLAVKPTDVVEVCGNLVDAGVRQVLSIAAGVKIATIENATSGKVAVIRAMPNTPALIGQGASAMARSASCSDENIAWAKQILLGVGTVVEVTEDLIDAVTGLSGSGPAYIFLLAEALIAAGVQQGLSEQVSGELVRQLLVGSSLLLAESSETPAQLRKKVTSPNGTTAAGIAELVSKQFAEIIASAVGAATARSKELGK
ncbi:MAG: pyrroline-5-carboxylate reductase [Actinomycetota bacterium]|nr:pyrroline-5-carboxylate reductase [Actinomycetota bacterium]